MSETLSLGGRQFAIRPLKLGQLRHLLDALDDMAGKSGGALIEAAAKVVAAGLGAADPQLDTAAVLDLEASVHELNAAVAAILRLAGLRPAETAAKVAAETAAGEMPPVASAAAISAPASETSSAPFTAPSPPAAAMPTATSTL